AWWASCIVLPGHATQRLNVTGLLPRPWVSTLACRKIGFRTGKDRRPALLNRGSGWSDRGWLRPPGASGLPDICPPVHGVHVAGSAPLVQGAEPGAPGGGALGRLRRALLVRAGGRGGWGP